jgi:hypothetical protein
MAVAARWIRLHAAGLPAMRSACTAFARAQEAEALPAALWMRIEDDQHAFAIVAPLKHLPGRHTRWRAWALAPLVATYRQRGICAYNDADRICLSGKPITDVSAAAVGACAVVVAGFTAWGGDEFMDFLRQRFEAQYGWEFDTAWPTDAERAAIEVAPAVTGAA